MRRRVGLFEDESAGHTCCSSMPGVSTSKSACEAGSSGSSSRLGASSSLAKLWQSANIVYTMVTVHVRVCMLGAEGGGGMTGWGARQRSTPTATSPLL